MGKETVGVIVVCIVDVHAFYSCTPISVHITSDVATRRDHAQVQVARTIKI